uniref:protein SCAI n=1 Tax=Fragaria vesca subsp. vesca TaxID=101020 RepID=UPI0005CAD921|nr:PREDICTED: protein SCAI [Fragaria vesca subsp. vesca]
MQVQQNPSIPVSEVYWSLLHKADKKFSKIRELPYYHRNRHEYDAYFYKVFKVYTQLWKFQQENRQKLVDAGLRRSEIGEIASRIAQLYLGQYMRTSEASYLSEAYIFYEAILSREYFKEGMFQDLSLANKQLRFISRFLVVCLLLNRREMVQQLLHQLKGLVDDCKRTFQETDFKEWKLVIQEIVRFLKADTAFMNIRPLRYSIVLECHPDSLPQVSTLVVRRSLRLRDAMLSSYHHNEVKFSEITLDTFRMLQCLEWEPSGSFYQPNVARNSQNGAPGSGRTNYSQDIADPTLPHNPRKAVLYRPSVTHFLAVSLIGINIALFHFHYYVFLACLLPAGSGMYSDANSLSMLPSPSDRLNPSCGQSKGDDSSLHASCLHFGSHGNGGINSIYPSDLVPFTRRPLFLVIDCDSSEAFEAINGVQKGETAAMLLSSSFSYQASGVGSSRQPSGSLFTLFLTAPMQAFCLLLGMSGADIDMDIYNKAEKLLSSSLSDWGSTLATSDTIDPVWAQVLTDPFLRRLILRFIFCRAVLSLYASTFNKKEFIPKSVPSLPASFLPTTVACQTVILQIANVFGASTKFIFSEGLVLPENRQGDDAELLPCS